MNICTTSFIAVILLLSIFLHESTQEVNRTLDDNNEKPKLLFYQYDTEANTSTLIADQSTPELYGLIYDIAKNGTLVKESQDVDEFPDSMAINCKSDFGGLSCGTFSLVGCTRNKRFYAESSLRMDWFDSWELCRSHGMTLASIESRYEQHILETYLIEKDFRDTSPVKPYWTSGTSFGRGSSYFWLATGKDFNPSFNYFLNEERASLSGSNGLRNNDGKANCVRLMISRDSSISDYWDIIDCQEQGFTLCQMGNI